MANPSLPLALQLLPFLQVCGRRFLMVQRESWESDEEQSLSSGCGQVRLGAEPEARGVIGDH